MDRNFWLKRWEREETGFHQHDVNDDLRRFWPALNPAPAEPVFVPLCGKSRDMLWLEKRGHPVVGVELSRLAVSAFFSENAIPFEWSRKGSFDVATSERISIFCGDFFDLTAEDIGPVRAAYDRAALIALPLAMRERYVAHLVNILEARARILLVTVDYPEEEIEGPPFAVPPAEVERLYGDYADVRLLSRRNILPDSPRFSERGLTSIDACAFLVSVSA